MNNLARPGFAANDAVASQRKGAALVLTIIIISCLAFLAVFLVKIVYNNYSSAIAAINREQAFYLAEAGLEKGKIELSNNPNWYTDLPYYLEDSDAWLVGYAVGQQEELGEGAYKIVREKGKSRLYSIGFKGSGVVILKIIFSNPPFQSAQWSEL